jgi:hypothetical protein
MIDCRSSSLSPSSLRSHFRKSWKIGGNKTSNYRSSSSKTLR